MTIETSLRFTDASGDFLFETSEFLEIGNNPGLHYVLSCGKVGALTVTIPPDFNSLLPKDGRIHVMRSVNGGPAQREGESCYLIRRWDFADDYTIVTALHANHILWRRTSLWPWPSGSSTADPGATADDTIKSAGGGNGAMWGFNFTASAVQAGRANGTNTGTDISALVSVQADTGAAPVIAFEWPWMVIGDAVLTICDASMTAGTYLAAEIVAPTENTLELRTYTDQRGTDRRFSSGSGLIFSSNQGNLANAILTVDAINEVTAVCAAGPQRDNWGTNVNVDIRTAEDTARINESPFGRIEQLLDDSGGQHIDATAIQADANAAVRNGRPIITATADLMDTDQCVRGIHYNYGDLVTVEVRGIKYDMRIDLLDVTLSGGVETTRTGLYYHG